MKRLVIMACYNPTGQIEEFERRLIKEVKAYASCFYIVYNGNIAEQAFSFLKNEASTVIVRGNIGYDAGAYKDAILQADLNEYDELLLLNDTFYGFFYSLDEFMQKTASQNKIDFWGLTKHPDGENRLGYFDEHIQAYFLLIKSRMLHGKDFIQFWEELSYPENYDAAVRKFEIRFSSFFKERGYKGAVYCDLDSIGIKEQYNVNPYLRYPYELVSQLRCPILKRKSFYIGNDNAWEALKYVRDNHLYDTDLICRQILLDYKYHTVSSYFNLYELEKFVKRYPRIYIYGKGKYGTAMYDYLTFRNFTFEKYIESTKADENDDSVIELSELETSCSIGIIVALKPQYTREVVGELLEHVSQNQLFCGIQPMNGCAQEA